MELSGLKALTKQISKQNSKFENILAELDDFSLENNQCYPEIEEFYNQLAALRAELTKYVDDILKETIYGILLGIDGEASIGGIQQTYKLYE